MRQVLYNIEDGVRRSDLYFALLWGTNLAVILCVVLLILINP